MRQTVRNIQGYDVIYVPERRILFCKNTAVPYDLLKEAVYGDMDRYNIPQKNLVIRKSGEIIEFGCLTTTIENAKNILTSIY